LATQGMLSSNLPVPLSTPRLCIECEEPIPLKRLNAHPNAHTCIPCQEKLELYNKTSLQYNRQHNYGHADTSAEDWFSLHTINPEEVFGDD
jgi:uncharacterized paraquat-inducible protein A